MRDVTMNLGEYWTAGVSFLVSGVGGETSSKLDMSIEGMRSQQFSIGVFIFMLVGVAVFSGIIYAVAFSKASRGKMRTGEKVMFGAVIAGTVLAVIFGAMQLVGGDLF